jgi:hypothetical protein
MAEDNSSTAPSDEQKSEQSYDEKPAGKQPEEEKGEVLEPGVEG